MGPRLNRPFTVVGVGAQHGIVELPPVLADRQNAAMRLDEVLAEPLEAWPSPPWRSYYLRTSPLQLVFRKSQD